MAKRKKQSSKVAKKKGAKAHPKAKKLPKAARGKAAKPTVVRAKPKRALVKKAARKDRMKQPVAPAVETVTVEHPAREFEEVSQVSPGPDEPKE